MKNPLKFLPAILILLSFASCEKRKDWTCVCRDTVFGSEYSRTVITDATEEEAIRECDNKDVIIQLGPDCSIEE